MGLEHLYIHVPFCARRCVYCDFSIAVRSRVPDVEYVAGIAREWDRRFGDTRARLATLYFGGGTPSKLGPDGVARLMDALRARVALAADAEVTLEANPEDVTATAAAAWHRAGINRVSLGVQSFDDRVLEWMHRTHDADRGRAAVRELGEAGLDNISIDLIFAVPAELQRAWPADLDEALALGLPHLSVYGLTVEPRTPLGRRVARRDVAESGEDAFEREFMDAHRRLTAAGLEHYEVSNYGRPGRHSRHNWAYWTRAPYGGLGPSAHEFDGRVRRWNVDPYAEWLRRVSEGTDPIEGHEHLSDEQTVAEEVYLGLRTSAGLVIAESERTRVQRWIEAGWAIEPSESRIRLTGAGWLRLDSLASDLTTLRSR